MRTIQTVYDNYRVPQKLQLHMLRVAAIADLICEAWQGPIIDRKALLRVLLLHDIGNMVKIDSKSEEVDSEWKVYQDSLKDRFGEDDHRASRELSKEIGLTEDELALMDGKIFVKNEETLDSDDYNRKIGAYSDQRVAPDGVYPLLQRLEEAKRRYRNKPGSSMNNPRTAFLIDCATKIENQVMRFCKLLPTDINNTTVDPRINPLRSFEI